MAENKIITEVEIKDKGSKELKSLTQNLQNYNKELDKNRDAQRGLDNLTGGAVSQFKAFRAQIKGNVVALKGLVKGLGGFKTALVATGIGAIVVLVGALAANWEKITKLLTGATIASQELAEQTKAIADQEQRKLDALNSQDNILKLQGKTEKEILELKAQQTKQTITALEASIEAQKEVKRQQVATAKRGQEILSTILKFVSAPLTLIVAQIDAIFGSNYMKIFDDAASLVFDPEKIGEQADEELEKTEQNLARLKNSYAGYQLSLNKIQADNQKKREDELKKQYDKELKLLQDKIKKEIELTDKGNKDVGAIRRDFFKRNFDDSEASQLMLSEFERDAKIKEIEESTANEFAKRLALAEVNKFYDTQAEEIRIDNAAKRKAAKEKEDKEQLEREAELEERKRALREKTFENAVALAGEESKLGKAILVAKTLLNAKEQFLEMQKTFAQARSTVTGAILKGAEAQAAVAAGSAETLKVGFPQNIPMIIAYAAQAVGVISAIKSATSRAKEAAAEAGESVSGGENIQAPVIPTSTPAFNIVGAGATNQLADAIAGQNQKPIRAFVVEEDVSMASQLARKIKNRASL